MRKRLGQHFLRNKSAIKKIVDALDLRPNDTVIEIGAGHGELTEVIEHETRNMEHKIVTIEKDRAFAARLKKRFSEIGSVEIVEGDALKIFPWLCSKFHVSSSKLVGNIPYYITGKLLRILSESENKPGICVFALQKEVAERVVAEPPRMNRLAAATQFWAEPKILFYVSRKDFSPPPAVDSAVVKLETRSTYHDAQEAEKYYKTVKALFAQPRKTILNNLADGVRQIADGVKKEISEKLSAIGVNPQDRPQDLSVEQIAEIAGEI